MFNKNDINKKSIKNVSQQIFLDSRNNRSTAICVNGERAKEAKAKHRNINELAIYGEELDIPKIV